MTDLDRVLSEARQLGYLGPGPTAAHVEHARALAELIGPWQERFVDLGSGGGVPAFVLLQDWPSATVVLVEAGKRRCEFLGRSLETLGLAGRVSLCCDRAEVVARDTSLRGGMGLVTARGFGRPAVTAECAVGFLRAGGRLAVSEPPSGEATLTSTARRWPVEAVDRLGFLPAVTRTMGSTTVAILEARGVPGERWPRRAGIPKKRPLW